MLVFVYGTLKKRGRLHHCLEGGTPKGEATLKGYDMYSVGGIFPGIVPGEGSVIGELFEIEDRTLQILDRVECYPELYDRKRLSVISRGREFVVWVYTYQHDISKYEQIKGGFWDVCDYL